MFTLSYGLFLLAILPLGVLGMGIEKFADLRVSEEREAYRNLTKTKPAWSYPRRWQLTSFLAHGLGFAVAPMTGFILFIHQNRDRIEEHGKEAEMGLAIICSVVAIQIGGLLLSIFLTAWWNVRQRRKGGA